METNKRNLNLINFSPVFPRVTIAYGVKEIVRNFNYRKNTVKAGGCIKLMITLINIKINVTVPHTSLLMRGNIVLMVYNYLSYLDYKKLEIAVKDPVFTLIIIVLNRGISL